MGQLGAPHLQMGLKTEYWPPVMRSKSYLPAQCQQHAAVPMQQPCANYDRAAAEQEEGSSRPTTCNRCCDGVTALLAEKVVSKHNDTTLSSRLAVQH